ncbi:twitching motility protein PilT [bacterium M00.F.Ca.ET.228.01.1.1]|uniref:Mut7-C RNAse domain-containing protein n=1 Tax=Paraburkholderia phenoliruptrix TaxID=252970 RepID=UPI0010929CD8|nr:Mut7-C RNAse domain-containing protein [Paraburkholderia phenoliruptrix]TGP45163.1 twitching motility protein PilT [bacterium M00.F.Ca.ET.228.01.1.1]TGS03046.1 twitching motility protein PilT [bacterium M00.F.Ca.ET.191.01.1.1]TGU06428.1 twitching motility protein PilT [bacterium M00.F.Ca.ET.155.01.1.1]MBW0448779.1 Mut7-C ubiquitin/RNAse domain-containing protein [Paraburkholderia phenoliruptrix]MBW9097756.1 Mut7-C ubiquitin/RNAse domain-containing protein [Paraburkholderia phenoliruptrix]
MVTATFRFYEELNDFLARPLRRRAFAYACARDATTKHAIEALGVPHTEVELILVNGESVGFNHPVADGDRVAVYPKFEALDIRPLLRVRERPLRVVRFIADAHLGGLAPLLRLAGFDTLYDNHFPDAHIEALAATQDRIVLTRDRELLKRRAITHGCYVRALRPREQLREVFERLDLAGSAQPFRLCLMCNAPLRRIGRDEVGDRAPDGVLQRHKQFVTCDVCRRVFWEGTHWQRMRALIDSVAARPAATDASGGGAGGALGADRANGTGVAEEDAAAERAAGRKGVDG